jgi:hypothetical protein
MAPDKLSRSEFATQSVKIDNTSDLHFTKIDYFGEIYDKKCNKFMVEVVNIY